MFSPWKRSLLAAEYKINSKQNNTFIAKNRPNHAFRDQSLSKNTSEQKNVNKKKEILIFWSINFFTANSKIIIMKWSRISSWLITQVGGDWRQLDGLKMQWRLPGEGQRLRKSFLSRTALCDLTRKIKSDGKFNYDWIAIVVANFLVKSQKVISDF